MPSPPGHLEFPQGLCLSQYIFITSHKMSSQLLRGHNALGWSQACFCPSVQHVLPTIFIPKSPGQSSGPFCAKPTWASRSLPLLFILPTTVFFPWRNNNLCPYFFLVICSNVTSAESPSLTTTFRQNTILYHAHLTWLFSRAFITTWPSLCSRV